MAVLERLAGDGVENCIAVGDGEIDAFLRTLDAAPSEGETDEELFASLLRRD